ncbi:hypothetical protein [Vandammella animalimorsus]|uniref:hypothetical protein n=1 Tax=Vandammella animalimorsus TaxID=2029117 RepID=UPI001EEE66B7|nr:hypothetical protein [Vandammella animalimorsus]
MPVFLKPLSTGYPGPPYEPELHQLSWRPMIGVEQDDDGRQVSCWAFDDMKALASQRDLQAMQTALRKLQEFTATGQLLSDLFDDKQLHTGFVCSSGTSVFRLRLVGSTRIYFVYGQCRQLILVGLLCKRVDKLSKGDQKRMCDRVAKLRQSAQLQ